MGIKNMSPRSGRVLKEDDTVVNQANMLEAIYKALVVDKNAGVALNGSLPNDILQAKKTIATFPYTQFPVSSTVYLYSASMLTPQAKRRSYLITQGLNQSLTNVFLSAFDDMGVAGSTNNGTSNFVIPTVANFNPYNNVEGNDQNKIANMVTLVATVGASAPTSGNITVYCREVL